MHNGKENGNYHSGFRVLGVSVDFGSWGLGSGVKCTPVINEPLPLRALKFGSLLTRGGGIHKGSTL